LVFQDNEAGKYINNQFVPLKVVKEEGDSPELKKKFNIPGYPTVIVVKNTGDKIDRTIGFSGKKDEFMQIIKDYAEGKNTLAAFVRNYQSDSLNVENNYALAKKHTDRFEREQAAQFFENVLKLDPNDEYGFGEESRYELAIHEARSNKNIDPLLGFIKGTANEDYLVKGYSTLINYYRNENDTSKVVTAYEEVISKMPDNVDLLNSYAWDIYTAKKQDMYDRGIELAKRAVELEPETDAIWDTLAWLYFEKGEVENAVKAMEKAVELDPESDYYKKNLQKMKSPV